MNAWLQRFDLSCEDFDLCDASAAVKLLRGWDWAYEQAEELTARGDACPAGLGLVAEDGHILHICPREGGCAMLHLHYDADGNCWA